MTTQEIEAYSVASKEALQSERVLDCFSNLSPLLKELGEWWAINREEELLNIYKQMIKYLIRGVEDPYQKGVYNRFKNDVYVLIDDVSDALQVRVSSLFEYRMRRFQSRSSINNLNLYFQEFKEYGIKHKICVETGSDFHSLESSRLDYEHSIADMFLSVWLTHRCQNSDIELMKCIIEDDEIELTPKALLISALTLSLLRVFDVKKLQLILQSVLNTSVQIRERAIVGLLLVVSRHYYRIDCVPVLYDSINDLLKNGLQNELERVFLQLVRTSETESISKRVKDELLPEMMKYSPKIKDKLRFDLNNDGEEMNEKNPEWESLFENDAVSDKIKEFGDLQMQGSDVYVTTFASLKSFPFFSSASGWFMPFDTDNSAVNPLFAGNAKLLTAFVKSPFLCNSDKYSFCLSLLQMPESQRDLMGDAFKQESDQLNEMISEEQATDKDVLSKNICNQYIQDIYRFYTLHPHHSELSNPLVDVLAFYKRPLFKLFFNPDVVLKRISEFYFSKNLYKESLEQFMDLADQNDVSILQKIGYCYQQLHDYQNAILYYQKADLLDGPNRWTLARLGHCYRFLGDFTNGLGVYKKLHELYPDEGQYQSRMASCLYQLGRYEDALNIYYRLDYYEPNNKNTWRLIAWCNVMCGKFEQAWKYYFKLLDNVPDSIDYLNIGHLCWIEKKSSEAYVYYKKSIATMGKYNQFKELFLRDIPTLMTLGVDIRTLNLMLDALVLFNSELEL